MKRKIMSLILLAVIGISTSSFASSDRHRHYHHERHHHHDREHHTHRY